MNTSSFFPFDAMLARALGCLFFVASGLTLARAENAPRAAPVNIPAKASNSSGQPATGKNYTLDRLKLELIWVKPGTFTMGSPPEEQGRNKAEGPLMKVTLSKGFWLAKTEMTQGQYEAEAGTNPSHFKEVGPDAPAERVSWLMAMDFCEKLTAKEKAAGRLPEGYEYTLPTEAQWEYACRAGTTGAYAGNPESMAWHKNNSDGATHPVARKKPNEWGFHDIYGNVLEWCYDWYDGGAYPGGSVTDPTGPKHGYFRMARGGSWRIDIMRSAQRSGGSAGREDYTLGFRLALAPVR